METSKKTLSTAPRPGKLSGGNGAPDSVQLLEKARADTDTVLKELGTQLGGLSAAEAAARLKQVGTNAIAREKRQSALMRLLLVIVAVVGAVAVVGCGKKSDSEPTKTAEVAERTGAALDKTAEKTVEGANNVAKKATESATATAAATNDVAGRAVEKTGKNP
jgi:hypothetical protein